MIRVGTAGWSIPRGIAAAFPPTGSHLARYASTLPCVEIDSAFYRSHRFETYRRWASTTPRHFRFSVKLPRVITHEQRLRHVRAPLDGFLAEVRGLGRKLGPLLVQLPPSLAFERRAARGFFARVRDRHDGAVVCEPRHPSWFGPNADELMHSYRVGRVAADPACVREAAVPGGWIDRSASGGTAYFRLHGSPRLYWSPYPPEALEHWYMTMHAYARGSNVWCIFDNTAAGAATGHALELSRRVAARGASRRAPAAVP